MHVLMLLCVAVCCVLACLCLLVCAWRPQGTLFSAGLLGDIPLMTSLLHPSASQVAAAGGDTSEAPRAAGGFSVEDRDEEGNTPLHVAAHSNQVWGA